MKDITNELVNNTVSEECGVHSEDCNVCFSSYTCSTCYYYDGSYHGGYCDKYGVDTNPGNSCGSWVSN